MVDGHEESEWRPSQPPQRLQLYVTGLSPAHPVVREVDRAVGRAGPGLRIRSVGRRAEGSADRAVRARAGASRAAPHTGSAVLQSTREMSALLNRYWSLHRRVPHACLAVFSLLSLRSVSRVVLLCTSFDRGSGTPDEYTSSMS